MHHVTTLVLGDEVDALHCHAELHDGLAVVRFGDGVRVLTSASENPAELLAQTLIRLAGDLRRLHRSETERVAAA